MESKSERFYTLLKNINYPVDSFSPSTFDYLFEIPETRSFFEWFINNANEACYISKEKLEKFSVKAAKGQVIYDLDKLEQMHKLLNLKRESKENRFSMKNLRDHLLNSSECKDDLDANEFDVENCNDIDILKKQIERTEKEVQLLRRKYEFNKFCQKKFNEELKEIKTNEEFESRLSSKLDEKENYIKTSSKTINQILNKTFIDLQAKLTDEDRINIISSNDDEMASIENYLTNEKNFLGLAKKLMSFELDCTDLKNLSSKIDSEKLDSKEPSEHDLLNQKQFQIIMKKKFPKAMDEWIQSKVASRTSKILLDELNRIDSEFDQFFVHTEEQLKQNPEFISQIEVQIRNNETTKDAFLDKYKNLVNLMPALINQLAYLKMVHLACIDLEKKEIDLNLFYNKQDKLFKILNQQKSRIEFINYVQDLKLNNLEQMKHLFEELLDDTRPNPQNSTNSTSLYANQMISIIQPNKNMNLSNFNQFSNANMLSSTMAFNSTMCSQFISSPSKQLSSKFSHTIEPPGDPNSAFIHILNQFLINILTKFDQSDDLNEEIFKLKNPISINFNDNLENFVNLKTSINNYYKSHNNLMVLEKQCKYFFKAIFKSMEYLYEKDELTNDSSSKLKGALNFNLSKINIRMAKCLEEPITRLNEQSKDLQNLFAAKIFQNYNQFKHQFSTNNLANIKRNFFVHFFTNPKQIQVIMEKLNSI